MYGLHRKGRVRSPDLTRIQPGRETWLDDVGIDDAALPISAHGEKDNTPKGRSAFVEASA